MAKVPSAQRGILLVELASQRDIFVCQRPRHRRCRQGQPGGEKAQIGRQAQRREGERQDTVDGQAQHLAEWVLGLARGPRTRRKPFGCAQVEALVSRTKQIALLLAVPLRLQSP